MQAPSRVAASAAILGSAFAWAAWPSLAPTTPEGAPDESPGAPRERAPLLVDLRDGTSAAELAAFATRHGLELRWTSNHPSAVAAALAVGRSAAGHAVRSDEQLLAELASDPLVEVAEPNELYSIPDVGTFDEASGPRDAIPEEDASKPRDGFPNDSLFDKQWHLKMIHAPEAWKKATGKGVKVGVIDTGVAYSKKRGMLIPDLEKTAFVDGYDFVNDQRIAADDHGHGSHCAGTIAQSTNNGRGCAGVAPGATIMPLKVLSAQGSGTAADIAAAIRYAADRGCKVLNLSLGGGGRSEAMARAVKYAHDKGVVVCCAAGNSGRKRVEYPAAYDGALAVSSVGPSGRKAFYSSYGEQIWVAGPGGDKSGGPEAGVVQNTIDPRGQKSFYGFWQGTSMATPHVAGVAALLVEMGVTNPDAVREILKKTATRGGKPSGEWDAELGWGVIDAAAAVDAAKKPRDVATLLAAVGLGLLALGVSRGGRAAELPLGLATLGAVVGSGALGVVSPVDLGALGRGFTGWDLGNPLYASALVPGFLGLVLVPSRGGRSFALGLMVGCAASLASGAWFDYTDVNLIPWHALDRAWLGANAVALAFGTAVVVRVARGKGVA